MATTTNNLTRVSPGVYRNAGGRLVNYNPPKPAPTKPANTSNNNNTITVNPNKSTTITEQAPAGSSVGTNTNQTTTNNTQSQTAQTDRNPDRVKGRIDFLKKNLPASGTTPPPQGMRPDNVPTYNLLTEQERLQFIQLRRTDPRAALRWAEGITADRLKNSNELKTLQDWLTKYEAGQQPQTPAPGQDSNTAAPPPQENTPEPAPAAPAAPTAPALDQPYSGSTYDFANYQSPMTQALLNALNTGMSTMQAYEPKFFEGSPMYQFQKQKGMADLEKLMAARGLTGSGAEIQGNSDFLAQLNATEAEKQRGYAESNRDRQQRAMEFIANFDQSERNVLRDQWNKDLDQKTNMQQFEANRTDARQALAVNFLTNILGLQNSNDVAKLASGGLNDQTALSKALIDMVGKNIMSQTPQVSAGGGGAPPPPPASNNSGLMQILMNYGNNAGNNDFWNGLLRMIGGK